LSYCRARTERERIVTCGSDEQRGYAALSAKPPGGPDAGVLRRRVTAQLHVHECEVNRHCLSHVNGLRGRPPGADALVAVSAEHPLDHQREIGIVFDYKDAGGRHWLPAGR
jgi:hypothetical protein